MFKSEVGKREILALYDQKLESLNIKYQFEKVDTSLGITNVIITGDSSKPPLVLIHGSNGCAPVVLEAFPNIFDHYHIYAVDVVAQPNKSVANREKINLKDDSFGIWMNEILDYYKLNEVVMAGFSLGGLITLKTLVYDASKIKEVFLISPAYIVNGNPLKALFKVFIPMQRFMKSARLKYVDQVVKELFTSNDNFAPHFLEKVFTHFKMDFSPVPVIKSAQAKKITTPISLFAADDDLLFPGEKMLRRAKRIFPSLKRHILIRDSKHVQNREGMSKVEDYILQAGEN
jgi:pimeloyl-ACP methyl ester carboxylesterase